MKKIDNKFLDLILYFVSLILSFFRSILVLFGVKKNIKKGIFLKSLNFVFRLWPQSFWKKPNFLKIGLFIGGFIKYIFYNKK